MVVYGDSPSCIHVSSILSIDTAGDEAEVGWGSFAVGLPECGTTGNGFPHVFYTLDVGPFYECHASTELLSNASYSFSVRVDQSAPTTWIWDWNGTILNTEDLGFTNSANQTNGERHNLSESAKALFNGMQYRSSSGVWTAWSRSVCWNGVSDDPGYNNQLLSNTKVQVTTQAPSC
jgi:hypothetical protein